MAFEAITLAGAVNADGADSHFEANTKVNANFATAETRLAALEAAPPGGVASVNGETGAVTLDAGDIAETAARKWLSDAERTKLGGIATGATANATNAQLRDRATHTGTQSADTLVNGTTNRVFTQTQETKLAGVAAGATANAADADLRDRGTHTGTQAASTIGSGTFATARLGSGTPAAGTYVDGGTGAWTALPSGGGSTLPMSTKTANHTLALADAGTVVEVDSASPLTVTIPANATVAFPVNTWIEIRQLGTGSVTVVLASGVTGRPEASYVLRGQNATGRLHKRATNDWHVGGGFA